MFTFLCWLVLWGNLRHGFLFFPSKSLFYIVLRIGLFWRFDIRLQLVHYMFSAWIWGLIVFYFVVHPPIYLTSLAVIIMTITGAGIYFQVNLLTLLDKIDPRTTESFQAAMCIPLAVLLAAQPCYYFGFGTSSCNGQYEDFMRNVLVGIAVAIGICFVSMSIIFWKTIIKTIFSGKWSFNFLFSGTNLVCLPVHQLWQANGAGQEIGWHLWKWSPKVKPIILGAWNEWGKSGAIR